MKTMKARGMEQAPSRNQEDITGMPEVHMAGTARTGAGQREKHSPYPGSAT